MGEAENELRDAPRRIARERVPTIAVGRDLHSFPYVDAHRRCRSRRFFFCPMLRDWIGYLRLLPAWAQTLFLSPILTRPALHVSTKLMPLCNRRHAASPIRRHDSP